MRQQSALAATVVGLVGIGLGLAAGIAVVYWLGVVGGIAAVLAAYLTYLTANRISRAEERTKDLATQVEQLESAVANQIQARMSAEEDARKANIRAADAELTNALGHRATDSNTDATEDLRDPDTGLFGEGYFLVTVEQRISSARRHLRPVSIALVEVVADPTNSDPEFVDAVAVTHALAETLRDADTACRLNDGRFGLILEDTPENGAIWTIERLRRALVDQVKTCTLWAGLACYPAHGFDTDEILTQSELALRAARDWPQDRIEVAESR
ncbi:MAG: GGDEF domain-containing protein [Acidimicrobiales bacterium]